MENKGRRWKRIHSIAFTEYVRWLCNPRQILFVCFLYFANSYVITPLLEHATKMGETINVFEPFIAIGNNNGLIFVLPALFLVLISDFPNLDENALLYIHRCGKQEWLLAQMVSGLWKIATYLIGILLGTIILTNGNCYVGNCWSDVITKYYLYYPDEQQSYVNKLITGNLYNNFSVYQALGYTITLLVGYLFLLSMIKIVCFLFGNAMLGMVLGGGIIAIGCGLTFGDTMAKWIFPAAHALEWQHCDEVLNTMSVTMGHSYFYFLFLCLVMVYVANVLLERYNL